MYGRFQKSAVAVAVAAALSVGLTLAGGCQNKDQPKDSTKHSDGSPHTPGDMHPDHGKQGGTTSDSNAQ